MDISRYNVKIIKSSRMLNFNPWHTTTQLFMYRNQISYKNSWIPGIHHEHFWIKEYELDQFT